MGEPAFPRPIAPRHTVMRSLEEAAKGTRVATHHRAVAIRPTRTKRVAIAHASKRHAGVQIETDRYRLGLLVYQDKPLQRRCATGIRRRGLRSVLARESVRHTRCIGMRR
jgi:hypothetical protein